MKFDFQAFKDAVRASILIDLAELDSIGGPQLSSPEKLLCTIYEKHGQNKKTKKHLTPKKIVAIIIAAVLIIASALTALAFKEKLLDFIERREDTHTSLDSPEGESGKEQIEEIYLPSYIPERFSLKSHSSSSASVVTIWTDGESDMVFVQMPRQNTNTSINTENEDYTEAVFGNQAVYYTVKHGTFGAVWHTEDYVYRLDAFSPFDLEEIEKIIKSITYVEDLNKG